MGWVGLGLLGGFGNKCSIFVLATASPHLLVLTSCSYDARWDTELRRDMMDLGLGGTGETAVALG
jgi:hypothetical protein